MASASPTHTRHHSHAGKHHVHVPPDDPLFGWYIALVVLLVLLGGVFSGLTLGLMGLDSVRVLCSWGVIWRCTE